MDICHSGQRRESERKEKERNERIYRENGRIRWGHEDTDGKGQMKEEGRKYNRTVGNV